MMQKKEHREMKKLLIGLILLCVSFVQSQDFSKPREVFSRSFMFTRPASFNIEMDYQLWHNFVYAKEGPLYGGFQAIGFYQNSRSKAKVARYFLINKKNELLISGDANTGQILKRDIRAEWVNLPDDFKGKMSLCPEQKQYGFNLMYSQDLKKFFDFWLLKDWTVGVELPISRVTNNINFCQYDMSSSGTQLNVEPDIHSAFNQCDWNYSKIPTCEQSLTRPEALKFTIGRYFPVDDPFQLASFMTLSIPLAKKADPEFLYSPFVGLNKHWAFGTTVLMQVLLNRDPEKVASTIFVELNGLFLIKNHQCRTFDLKKKPWSRYMQYVRKGSAPGETVPGVNVLTFPTRVRPFGIADFACGWRVTAGAFEGEIGFDIWGHGDERLQLRYPVQSPFYAPCPGGLNEFGIAG